MGVRERRLIGDCVVLVRGAYEGVRWLLLFFKQKTVYEMLRSLVGSEMCIRDRWELVAKSTMIVESVIAVIENADSNFSAGAVSYTHLTLPTIYSV